MSRILAELPGERLESDPSVGGTAAGPGHGSDEFVRAVLANSSDLVIVVDALGILTYASPASIRILGHEPEAWIGRSAFDLIHPDDHGLAAEAMVTSAESGTGVKDALVLRILHSSGEWRVVEIVANNLLHDPSVAGLLVSMRDLTERTNALAAAHQHQRRFEQIFERAPIGMSLTDMSGRFLRVNRSLSQMLGFTPAELLTMTVGEVTHPDDRPLLSTAALQGDGASVELRHVRSNGSPVWVRCTTSTLTDEEGTPIQRIAQVEDIEDYRRLTDDLAVAATHDSLTGLLNRAGLSAVLERTSARTEPGLVSVLFIDLDHFKAVNDAHGHGAGDELLMAVAQRIRRAVRGGDDCCRLGGDEFVVVCRDLDDPDESAVTAERIRRALCEPFRLAVGPVSISCSIGISPASPGVKPAAVLAQADAAAYRAKGLGRNRVVATPEKLGITPPG